VSEMISSGDKSNLMSAIAFRPGLLSRIVLANGEEPTGASDLASGVTEWQVEHQADADRLQTGRDSTELRQTKVNNVPSTRLVDVKSEKVL
jgi:hypothetical protein